MTMNEPKKTSKAENEILICLNTLQEHMHTVEAAHYMFSLLEEYGLSLDRYNNQEPINIPFSVDTATKAWTRGVTCVGPRYTSTGNIFLGRCMKPRMTLMVGWTTSADMDCVSYLEICIMKNYFKENQNIILQMFKKLIDYFRPAHAYIGTRRASYRQDGAIWAKIPGIYWLNFFGKEYMDFIGEKHLLECDWHHTEPYGNGLMVWTTSVVGIPDDEAVEVEKRFRECLGNQYFCDVPGGCAETVPPVLLNIQKMILGPKPAPTPMQMWLAKQKAEKDK